MSRLKAQMDQLNSRHEWANKATPADYEASGACLAAFETLPAASKALPSLNITSKLIEVH